MSSVLTSVHSYAGLSHPPVAYHTQHEMDHSDTPPDARAVSLSTPTSLYQSTASPSRLDYPLSRFKPQHQRHKHRSRKHDASQPRVKQSKPCVLFLEGYLSRESGVRQQQCSSNSSSASLNTPSPQRRPVGGKESGTAVFSRTIIWNNGPLIFSLVRSCCHPAEPAILFRDSAPIIAGPLAWPL